MKNFFKGIVGFSIPTWIGFIISFLSTPIITRVFLPDEVGRINLFSTYLNFFMLIAYFGLDQAFVRFGNDIPGKYNKRQFFTVSLLASIIIGFLVSLLILIFSKNISLAITGNISFYISISLVLSLIANIILKFLNVYSRVENDMLLYSIQTISIVFMSKLSYIIVAFWSPTHNAAIKSMAIGFVVLSIIFLYIKRKSISIPTYIDKESIVGLLSFGVPLLPVTLLSWLNSSLPQLFLNRFVDFSAIGIYTSAVSVVNTMNLVQTGFNTYWVPFVYKSYKTKNELIKMIHTYITLVMCSLGSILILSQDLIYIFLGENYRASKLFFPFLLLTPIVFTISETTGIGIGIAKKSYLNIISFSINLFINIITSVILIPIIGVSGAAISSSISSLALIITKTYLGEKYYKSVTNYFKTFGSIGIVFAQALVNYLFFNNNVLKFPLIVLLFGFLLLLNRHECREIFNTIIRFLKELLNRRKM